MTSHKVRGNSDVPLGVIEEISVTPAGSLDTDLFDRQNLEQAGDFLKVRGTTRCPRPDIAVELRPCSLLGNKAFSPVELLDISRLGVAVSTQKSLRLRSKAHLKFSFRDGKEFIVLAQVCRIIDSESSSYGLCFVEYLPGLNEHIVKSGLQLKLKS